METERVERRLAAVLAADVAGYSRLVGLDEEGTLARLRSLRVEVIDPAIAAHSGRVINTAGDGMLVEFPSVVDAARCALAVQRGLASRNAEIAPDHHIVFRIGIHLGDVVVEGADLLGDAVNIAARLEGLAVPGGICLSEDAWRQVRDQLAAAFVDVGEQTLKNIARPVRVYRLDDNAQPRLPSRAPDASHPPAVPPALREAIERTAAELFVGRERERGQLEAALTEALGGRGRLELLAGEPGIGKTRLAECVAASATARGAHVIWGRCWEGEGAPAFWPWVQVLRACLRQSGGPTLASRLGPGAPYVAQLVPELRELLPDLPGPPPLDSEQARFRLYDACTSFLTSAAAATPLVLVLDDLHWADTSSLLLLQFLVREIVNARLLVLGTYRDVEVSRGHPLGEVLPRLRRERTVERVLLRGLPEDEVSAMLAALRGEDVPQALARAISRETEGNPFFVQEIVRHLADEGMLGREGAYRTSQAWLSDLRLPESVRDVIGRRLGRLSGACTKCLTAAAVVGKEFGVDALERIADLDEERLLEVLEEAVTARVLEEVPQAVGRYRFAHALIRETLYEELRTLERVRRHHRVGVVLEQLYGRNPEPHLAELAYHFLEALPAGDVEKAVGYATRAGDRASAQLACEDAALHYERALQALELREAPEERLRCELLLKLGEAWWSAGGFERATKALEEAAVIAERLRDPEALARAALGLGGPGSYVPGDWTRVPLFEKALTALGDRDSALQARLMGRLAGLRTYAGDPEGTAPLARAAIEMARRVGDARALAYVLSATCRPLGDPDDVEERLARADELIRLAEEAGDERLAVEGHNWKTMYYLEIGDVGAADREMEIQQRRAEASRQALCRWWALLGQGARRVLEGRFDEAEGLFQQALEIASEGQLTPRVMALQGARTLALEQQGRDHELLPSTIGLVTAAPKITMNRASVARMRVAVGDTEAARRDLESLAVHDFRDIPRNGLWLFSLALLCDVVSFFGDAEHARMLYDLLLPYGDRCVVAALSACRGSVSRSLGLLATVLSRYDQAERHFEHALEMNARIRARIWVAHTQHDYARMLVARNSPGDRERAAALAAQALATAREVGMKPLEAKVVELQGAAGLGEAPSTEPPREGPLTPAASAVFRRDGDVWMVAYEGKQLRLRDAKGLQYIAHLLRHTGQEFHAADLAAGAEAIAAPDSARGGSEATEVVAGLGDAGEQLDAPARAAYRQRLQDLEAELAEATQWADTGRAEKLRGEVEFLREELSAAYGLGGRARKAADTSDRARKAVTSRIRESIERIGKEHPALGRHFENAIRTGTFCRYQPERPLRWEV